MLTACDPRPDSTSTLEQVCIELPLSGAEPPYEPDKWNDNWGMQYTNNCYSYAADDFNPHKSEGRPTPGATYTNVNISIPVQCNEIMFRTEGDGFERHSCETACNNQRYKVMVFVSPVPEGIGDYHFYRQDQDGTWSHKRGLSGRVTSLDAVGNTIIDPRCADKNYLHEEFPANYSELCGCMCVERGTTTEVLGNPISGP